jgi:uncharacterized membrane protein YeaQ/YmgE (transglycosylase-associated protein family)
MLSILVWCVYVIFVGSIAKSIVPGEENFSFLKTVALGIAGSYIGGAILYLIGSYENLEPSGIFMGNAGSTLALVLYNKLIENTK